ncbi:MAG: hypothetical protein IVW51_09415 [Thermaceae bacterium]|nr:hypothetical protein [Thermaceae bacterium]
MWVSADNLYRYPKSVFTSGGAPDIKLKPSTIASYVLGAIAFDNAGNLWVAVDTGDSTGTGDTLLMFAPASQKDGPSLQIARLSVRISFTRLMAWPLTPRPQGYR